MSFRSILSTPGIKPVLFTLFMAAFGFGVILPIFPFYAVTLGATPFELGMLTAVFAFMSLIFSPVFGKLADKYGRKPVLLISTAGFAASYILFAFADTLTLAFAARGLEGIFAAGVFPACVSLLSDLTSEEHRGKAMGLVGMTFSLGFIVGPAFGGIASGISVHAVFWLAAAFSALNFVSVFFQLREPHEKKESHDIVGKEVTLLEHISSPLLFLLLASMMTTFMVGGIQAVLAIYTGDKLGFTSSEVGLLFTYIGFLIMIAQFLSGNLVNRFGEVKLIKIGLVISGTGFFFLAFANDWLTLLLPLAVFVIGNSMTFPSVTSLLTKKVHGKRGAILGLNASFQNLGQIIGPLLGGLLYSINHTYAFVGLALCIWAYALVFSTLAARSLSSQHAKN
jgi:multidrug resistance protein